MAVLHAYLIRYLLSSLLLSCEESGIIWLRLYSVPIPTMILFAGPSYIVFQYLGTCRKSIEGWSGLLQIVYRRWPLLGKPTATWQFSFFQWFLRGTTIDFEELVVLLPHELILVLSKIDHVRIRDVKLYSWWQWAVLLRCLCLPHLSTSIGKRES